MLDKKRINQILREISAIRLSKDLSQSYKDRVIKEYKDELDFLYSQIEIDLKAKK